MTDSGRDQGAFDAPEAERLQFLEETELREGDTDDPNEAAPTEVDGVTDVDSRNEIDNVT
jgi:hypothetical protein